MAVSSSPDTTSSIIREELKKILLSWCCHLKKKKQQKSRNACTESQMRKKSFKLSYVIRCCYVMISNLSMVTHFLNATRDFALKMCQIFKIVAFVIWVFFPHKLSNIAAFIEYIIGAFSTLMRPYFTA